MPETCALDVADRGGASSERLAELTNLTRERVRQIEAAASALLVDELRGFVEGESRAPLRAAPRSRSRATDASE
jgi:hypothetical protein